MADPIDRLDELDRMEPPDVWAEVQRRGPRAPTEPPSTSARRVGVAVLAFAVFIAGGWLAWTLFRNGTSPPGPTAHLHSHPVSVSATNGAGSVRCTATFPSTLIVPGRQTDVRFTVSNISDKPIHVSEGAGNGETGYLLERTLSGALLQDTSYRHDGIIGGFPMPIPVKPGGTYLLPAYDAPLLWPGTIVVTPICPVGTAIRLPPVQLHVLSPGIAPSAPDAVRRAVAAESPELDHCAPGTSGDSVIGTFEGHPVRCEALVITERGFDVVVLAIYSPPPAAPTDLHSLAYSIAASPFIHLTGSESVAWRVLAVSSSGVVKANVGAVAQNCDGYNYSAGGQFIACDHPTSHT